MPQKKLVKDMTILELEALIIECIRKERTVTPGQPCAPKPEDVYNQLWITKTVTGTEYVKHIQFEEGSRFHVVSYDTNGCHCNVPNCEINKPIPKARTG